jgi:hypothetical protein
MAKQNLHRAPRQYFRKLVEMTHASVVSLLRVIRNSRATALTGAMQ